MVSISWADENAHQDGNGNYYQYEDNLPSPGLHDHDEDVLDWCDYDKEILARGALVFGVELELEPVRHSSQGNLVEALGGRTTDSYILKDDASLESGVELVCIPLTLEQHRTSFGWEEVLSPVQNIAKGRARNCGQHVHINKAALTPFQIGKMLVFLNSRVMRERITTVAQRESNDYCRRSEKKVTDGGAVSGSRYDIVNVGERTVEVRMFQATIRADLVLKNVEFCHALVMFCRDASLNSVEQWDTFASWLVKRRGQYPNLVKFLAEQREDGFGGLIRPRKVEQKEAVGCA